MFEKLAVKKIQKETADCVSITFDVPLELKKEFNFNSGQYLTLKFEIDGKEERRSYSICTAPYERILRIAAKKIPIGKVSSYLNDQLMEGDIIEVMKPMGNFTVDIKQAKRKHVAFAAGSGITPVISIIKDVLKNEPKSEFHLYYGNKSSDSIIFKQELDQLEEEHKKFLGKRFKVHHYLSKEKAAGDNIYGGRITKEVLQDAIRKHIRADEFYLCGPEEMVNNAREIIASKAIDSSQVHFELFTTTGAIEPKEKEKVKPPSLGGAKAKVTVILDGSETQFEMDPKESVLNAAIDQGLDVPYACQGGTCCTCRAMLEEGNVEMDVNMVLTDHELSEGYVLTCQSHPTTSEIKVNYDHG